MLSKRKIVPLFLWYFILNFLHAQLEPGNSFRDYFIEGNRLIQENNFSQAVKSFRRAYEMDSENHNVCYLLGYSYLSLNNKTAEDKNRAEKYLSKAVQKVKKNYFPDDYSEKSAPLLALYYYAQALHLNYKFDEAIQYYDKFLASLGNASKSWEKEVTRRKNQCLYAKTLVQKPVIVEITNMGDSINSEFAEYSPLISADEQMMIFTTRRPAGFCNEKTIEGDFYEDIVVSYRLDEQTWTAPRLLGANVNSCGHEASANLTADGQILILYKDIEGGNIYFSQWDGKDWSAPQSFGSDLNTKYWETHACMSADGNTIYFVSDRPGGLGGRDIYRIKKLPNGKWSKAYNIGPPVNSPYDEDAVFLHPDGKTMYFSSNGHQTMGGFDIFYTVMDEEGKFSEPINMGYPINTTDDDVFYITSPDGKRAYYASVQEGGYGNKDIYRITFPSAEEKPVVIYKGRIVTSQGEPLPDDITIVITNMGNKDVEGINRPRRDGNFVFTLRPGNQYRVSFQSNGEEFYSEEIYADKKDAYTEIQKELLLEPIRITGKLSVKNKSVIMNVSCFNNIREKKPVANAVIYLMEESNKNFGIYKTDENGTVNNILLSPGKTYTLHIEHGFEGSESKIIQTPPSSQIGELLSEVFFLEKEDITMSKKTLSLTVINAKTKKPIPDASVIIRSDDANKVEHVCDAKGSVSGIELISGLNYTIIPYKSGYYGEPVTINPLEISENSIRKTLSISLGAKAKEDVERFEVYFKYKEYAIDTNSSRWKNFINNIMSRASERKVRIYITASASKVPASMTNIVLSKMRGEFLRDRIFRYISNHGGNKDNIHFKINAVVSGPPYNKKTHPKIYERYQYVKAIVD